MQFSKSNYRWLHRWQDDLEMLATALQAEDRPGLCAAVYTEDVHEAGSFIHALSERLGISKRENARLLYADQMRSWSRNELAGNILNKVSAKKRSVRRIDQNQLVNVLDEMGVMEPFDRMGRESMMLSKHPYLLKWVQYIGIASINPVSILLLNKWRVLLNGVLLIATYFGYQLLAANEQIAHFMYSMPWMLYPLWIPYGIKLLLDVRWLNRLYLLMDGALSRYRDRHAESSNLEVMEQLRSANTRPLIVLTGLEKCQEDEWLHVVKLLNWYVQSGTCDLLFVEPLHIRGRLDKLFSMDLTFSLPLIDGNHALQHLAELSGIQVKEEESHVLVLSDALTRPFDRQELETLYAYRTLLVGSPVRLSRFFLNYRLLSGRMHGHDIPGMMLLLIMRCFYGKKAGKFYEAVDNATSQGYTTTGELLQSLWKQGKDKEDKQDFKKMLQIDEISTLPITELRNTWELLKVYL